MRIQTESGWMRIGCALVVFTWATILEDQLALPRLCTWLNDQRPSDTCLWSACHRCNPPVSPSFAPLTSTTTHTWHKTSLLLASLPREGFLSCDFLSTPTFYIGDSVWMRIETTSGGDFDQCEFNSLLMRIETMRIHVNTTNAHRMRIRCASMPPCERALILLLRSNHFLALLLIKNNRFAPLGTISKWKPDNTNFEVLVGVTSLVYTSNVLDYLWWSSVSTRIGVSNTKYLASLLHWVLLLIF